MIERRVFAILMLAAATLAAAAQEPSPQPRGGMGGNATFAAAPWLDIRDAPFAAACDGRGDDGPAIARAIEALPHNGGVIWIPAGTCRVASTVTVGRAGVTVMGGGHGHRLRVATAEHLFEVRGPRFKLLNLEIDVAVSGDRRGAIVSAHANQGEVANVRLTGSPSHGNGHGFLLDGAADGWTFNTVRVPGGVRWETLWTLRASQGTVASTHVRGAMLSNRIVWGDASIVLDTGVDTFVASDSELAAVRIRNTLGRQAARWIRFFQCYFESTGVSVFDVTDVRDLTVAHTYFASSVRAARIDGGYGIRFLDNHYAALSRNGFEIRGGSEIEIRGGMFEDAGGIDPEGGDPQGAGKAVIALAPPAADIEISGLRFRDRRGAKPAHHVAVAEGAAGYLIFGNDHGYPGADYTGDDPVLDAAQFSEPLTVRAAVVSTACFRSGGSEGAAWCSGTELPAECAPGDLFSDTDGDGGSGCAGGECTLFVCGAGRRWHGVR